MTHASEMEPFPTKKANPIRIGSLLNSVSATLCYDKDNSDRAQLHPHKRNFR